MTPKATARTAQTAPRVTTSDRPTKVIDTNVLLSDPNALFAFEHADVVITGTVLRELGSKKGDPNVGYTARETLRLLDQHLLSGGKPSTDPHDIGMGSTLRLVPNGVVTSELEHVGFDKNVADIRIIGACIGLRDLGHDVTLITNDTEMRLVASVVKINSREHLIPMPAEHAGKGWKVIESDNHQDVDNLHRLGRFDLDHPAFADYAIAHNEGILLRTAGNPKHAVLARRKGSEIIKISDRQIYLNDRQTTWFKPRSMEQKLALELLLDPDVSIVALTGKAGTGKSLMALASAIHNMLVPGSRSQSIGIYRNPIAVGGRSNELGHLPGDLDAKLGPWMGQVSDSMSALLGPDAGPAAADEYLTRMTERGQMFFGSLAHTRGRSIANSTILLEEAQNCETHTLRMLASRAAEGTKLVLLGDLGQIDSPWLSRSSSGLTRVIEAFHGNPLFGHVELTKGERSPLAELAATLL